MPAQSEDTGMSEWQDAAVVPNKRLMGFAPGKYMGRCMRCEGKFMNLDKRARHCLSCAIDEANEFIERLNSKLVASEAENSHLHAAIAIVTPAPQEQE
jgi:hypothetical protein